MGDLCLEQGVWVDRLRGRERRGTRMRRGGRLRRCKGTYRLATRMSCQSRGCECRTRQAKRRRCAQPRRHRRRRRQCGFFKACSSSPDTTRFFSRGCYIDKFTTKSLRGSPVPPPPRRRRRTPRATLAAVQRAQWRARCRTQQPTMRVHRRRKKRCQLACLYIT